MNHRDRSVIVDYPIYLSKKFKPTVFGKNYLLRSYTVIYANCQIGKNFQTGHHVVIRENNFIGDDVVIGIGSYLGPNNRIGNHVTIHSHSFLEEVRIGNNVFIGPGTVFTNDLHPPCPSYKKCLLGAKVGDNVSIGANCTILPGIDIGRNAVIAAGSVVINDVLPNKVVCGNPARIINNRDHLSCLKKLYQYPYEWQK